MTKHITLCADDYAQSPGISDAIVRLIDQGRLSAVSVFSQSPDWPKQAQALIKYQQQIDIGLHFNLTHGFKTTDAPPQSLGYWLINSSLHLLSQTKIKAKICRQIDLFTDALGVLPSHIDGHQHVHVLPVIRQALMDAIIQYWPAENLPYVRAPEQSKDFSRSPLKTAIIKLISHGFSDLARKHNVKAPQQFSGIYSLKSAENYAAHMQHWLSICPDQTLLMCHPSVDLKNASDSIAAARFNEYSYLASDDFVKDCERYGVHLTPYPSFRDF